MSDWFVYIVRCADDSLYTGVAKNVDRRIDHHNEGKGARYTRGRGPVALVASVGPFAKGDALRLEMAVKAAPRHAKVEVLKSAR